MKSRKLKAILAIASAIAMLTVSMAGFAATVSTLTKYNLADATKVEVQTKVTGATDDSLITYLVTDPNSKIDATNKIVYIDQKKVTNGEAVFNYVIDKDNMASLSSTTVSMGTNNPANTDLTTSLEFRTYENKNGENYSVIYQDDKTIGNGEKMIANIVAAEGYEIVSYTITDDNTEYTYNSGAIELAFGKEIADVEVVEQEKAPVVSGDYTDSEVLPEGGISYTQLINVTSAGTANITEIGLYWNGVRYPAMASESNKATTTAAVQIIDPNTDVAAADATAYYIVDDATMYDTDGDVMFTAE